jgi:hypothetical protein
MNQLIKFISILKLQGPLLENLLENYIPRNAPTDLSISRLFLPFRTWNDKLIKLESNFNWISHLPVQKIMKTIASLLLQISTYKQSPWRFLQESCMAGFNRTRLSQIRIV